ncbi:hypothetical protein [Microbacterium sp. 5K110]|uniref:hypothetical protein n=1 Tax=Microbacterium sp. 5K110 TaxID=2578104 RepID=UPI00148520AB|nr:hypothetical protein [Microbacterium sp. 5K110]
MDTNTRNAIENARNAAANVTDGQTRTALLALVAAIEAASGEGSRANRSGAY